MWCPNCNEIFDADIKECPFCGKPLSELPEAELAFGSDTGEQPVAWPYDDDGNPVEEIFLKTTSTVSFEDEMICSMFAAYDIPTLKKYPNNGEFGRIIFGTGVGIVDIFVPATMYDEAARLLESPEGTNEKL